MIAEHLHNARTSADPEELQPYRPRPSSSGPQRCTRQMVYHAIGTEPKPISGRLSMIFDSGHWAEDHTAAVIEAGIVGMTLHSRQKPVTLKGVMPWRTGEKWTCDMCGQEFDPSDLHGHIDGILSDETGVFTGGPVLWEHKYINSRTWEMYFKAEDLPLDYFAQASIYARALCMEWALPKLSICETMRNRNTDGFFDIRMSYDVRSDTLHLIEITDHTGHSKILDELIENIVTEAMEKFRRVDEYAAKLTLPRREYAASHWRCGYCAYRDLCWAGAKREFEEREGELTTEDPDDERVIREFHRIKTEIADLKKEESGIVEEASKLLEKYGIKKVRLRNGLGICATVQTRKVINKEKIPPVILAQAEEEGAPFEVIRRVGKE